MVKNNSVRNEQGERGNDRKGKFKRVFFEHIRGAKKYSSLTPYINSPLCRYSFPFLTSPVLFFNLCLPLPFVTATYDLWSSEDYYRFKMRVEVGATVKDYVECVVSALKVHISKITMLHLKIKCRTCKYSVQPLQFLSLALLVVSHSVI